VDEVNSGDQFKIEENDDEVIKSEPFSCDSNLSKTKTPPDNIMKSNQIHQEKQEKRKTELPKQRISLKSSVRKVTSPRKSTEPSLDYR